MPALAHVGFLRVEQAVRLDGFDMAITEQRVEPATMTPRSDAPPGIKLLRVGSAYEQGIGEGVVRGEKVTGRKGAVRGGIPHQNGIRDGDHVAGICDLGFFERSSDAGILGGSVASQSTALMVRDSPVGFAEVIAVSARAAEGGAAPPIPSRKAIVSGASEDSSGWCGSLRPPTTDGGFEQRIPRGCPRDEKFRMRFTTSAKLAEDQRESRL